MEDNTKVTADIGNNSSRSSRNPRSVLGSNNSVGNAPNRINGFEKDNVFRSNYTSFSLATKKYINAKTNQMSDCVGGIPLDWDKGSGIIYTDSKDSHTVCIGSTGSKKSRLVAIPSVFLMGFAEESMIISDPKGEIYNRSAKTLHEKGYDINVINLRNPTQGSAWNPLHIPYQFYLNGDIDKAYEFVNDIAVNLMLSEIAAKDPYWDYSACNLFFGLTLLLFKYCKHNNLPADYASMKNLLALRQEMFEIEDKYDIQRSEIWRFAETDNIIASNLRGIVVTPDKTMSCILSTFDQKMRCFMLQPNLVDMLSHNTVSLDTIGEKKTVFYLLVPDEKSSYHKLVTIFVKQSYEYMIYVAQRNGDSKMPVRVNYILDEFSSLPTIADFPVMITAARSRNIRFNLFVQSKHQLLQRYQEETETILSNCSNWIFLTSREISVLRDLCDLCGKDQNNKDLVSIPFLQHMNKDEGEALILSNRLRPYVAHLADIDFYDGGPGEILQINSRLASKDTCEIESFNDIDCNTDSTESEKSKKQDKKQDYDIQKELEAKFDELFGKLDDTSDSSDNDSESESDSKDEKPTSARLERKRKRKTE